MVQRVEEVWKVAKVGSQRTPSHPVFRSEVQGGKEGSQKAFLPPDKETMAKAGGWKEADITKSLWRSGRVQEAARRLKNLFDKAGRVGWCFSQ